jgi:hypothetical protein
MKDMSAVPRRPPMDPAGGYRRQPLRPHETSIPLTAVQDLLVLAHFGIPRVDPGQWSLQITGGSAGLATRSTRRESR